MITEIGPGKYRMLRHDCKVMIVDVMFSLREVRFMAILPNGFSSGNISSRTIEHHNSLRKKSC